MDGPPPNGEFDAAKAAGLLKDRKAMREAMEQLKEDRTMLPAALKKFNEDQRIRRNLNNAAEQIRISRSEKKIGRITGKQRVTQMKEQKQEENTAALAKCSAHLKEDDITCVIINPKGKIAPYYLKKVDINDDKYCMHSAYLDDTDFLVLSSFGIGGAKNPKATDLLNEFVVDEQIVCYGHIIFVAGRTVEVRSEKKEVNEDPEIMSLDIHKDGSASVTPIIETSTPAIEFDSEEEETYIKFEPMKISMKKFEELIIREMANRKANAEPQDLL